MKSYLLVVIMLLVMTGIGVFTPLGFYMFFTVATAAYISRIVRDFLAKRGSNNE